MTEMTLGDVLSLAQLLVPEVDLLLDSDDQGTLQLAKLSVKEWGPYIARLQGILVEIHSKVGDCPDNPLINEISEALTDTLSLSFCLGLFHDLRFNPPQVSERFGVTSKIREEVDVEDVKDWIKRSREYRDRNR